MKKLLCLLMALVLVLGLTACGGGKSDQPAKTDTPVNTDQPAKTDAPAKTDEPAVQDDSWFFRAGATKVFIDANMADVKAALGEPNSYFEAESCAFEGLDKTFTYTGYVITTRPDDDQDFISSILLVDDSVSTPEGLYIGSTEADVERIYGEQDAPPTGLYAYTKGNACLQMIVKEGKVISIEYLVA